jgi:hypothetical protein
MTTFKVGDLVVPKNKEQREAILSQASYSISFPCRVIGVYGSGPEHFLYLEKSNGDSLGLYAYRFSKAAPIDKPLEEYL